MKKRSTYPGLSFHIEKLIFYSSSDSYHDFLFVQMQIMFPGETVNECESRLFLRDNILASMLCHGNKDKVCH